MTTLTANSPRLPGHCSHKLPTSCRLTALPICCACQDKRPHSSSYSKYIDGVGFVLGGTRQERYCWTCKEFWNARIAASGFPQSETRIPEIPDQTIFTERWFEWQQGYRVIKHEDGREERQALLGESLAEAAPGYLPRTLNELRSGVTSSQDEIQNLNPIIHDLNTTAIDSFEIDPEDRIFDPPSPTHRSAILQTGQPPRLHAQEVSLTLPQDTSINHVTTAAQVSHQLERVAALRSELQRIRVGIELVIAGLHDLRGVFPDSEDALQDTSNLHNRVTNIQNLLTSAGQVQNSNQSGFSSSGSNMDTDEMEWTTDGSSRPSETQNPAPAARLGNTSRPSLQQLATSSGPRIEPYHTRIRSPPTPGPLAPLRRTPILTNSNTMPQGGTTQQSTSQVASTSTTGPSSNPVRTTGGQITGVSLAERELLALRRRRDHARETETQLNARRTAAARTLERARVELEVAMRERERAERTYDTVERTQSRNTRVWGTQEEMDRQGSNYVSPITSMFMSQSQSQSQQTGSVTSRSQRTVEEQMRDYQAAELRRAASRRAPPLEDHPSSDGPFSGSQPLFLPSDFRASRYSESEHESDSEDDDEDGNEDYNERLASSTAAEARIEATTRRAEPELGRPAGSLETGNRFRRAVTASRPSPSNVLRPRPRRAPQAPLSDEEETERLTGMLTQITADLRAEHPEGSWEEAEQRRQFNMIYASLFDDIDPRNPQSEARANGHPIGTALSDGAQAVLDELNYTSGRTARQNVPPRPRDINDPDELLSAAANRRRAAIDDRAHLAAARAYLDNYNISARRRTGRPPEELKSLDKKKDGRPEPANEEDMMIKMECKICFAQVATVAVLPCGHCVMCKWCADEAIPSHARDRTAPADRRATCPVCRRGVKSKVTIYGGEQNEKRASTPAKPKLSVAPPISAAALSSSSPATSPTS